LVTDKSRVHYSGEGGAIRSRRGVILLVAAAMLTAGVVWSWKSSEAQYRDELLQAIRIARAGNNPRRLQHLTATKADYTNPDYLWLKRELTEAKEAVPKCHWLYIARMGKKGEIVTLCDSENDSPDDPLPPGYIYEDTSGVFTDIIHNGVERVWGPYSDAFGTWVTAAVPIWDDETGEIVAVLGMDVDFRDARVEILRRAIAPLAFTILITLMVAGAYFIFDLRRQRNRETAEVEAARIRMKRFQALAAVAAHESLARGDITAFARELTEQAARAMGVERVGVWVFDQPRTTLVNVDTFLMSQGVHEGGETMDGDAFRREWEALDNDRYFSAPDAMTDPRTEGYRPYLIEHGIVSMLDTAVRSGCELLGAVCFEHTGDRREWTEGEIGFACQAADLVTQCLANRREREERARQLLLTTAMEQAEEAIMITDAEARLIYVNAAFERVTGYRRDEVLGKTPAILKSGHQSASFYQEMWSILLSGESWTGRLVNRRKDGELITVQETIAPVRDTRGETAHYISTMLDITEELKEVERLQETRRMEAVGRLAGGVAHDFNNMLNVIIGHVDMALEELPEDAVLRQDIEEIQRAALRAASLTRQLLDFARRRPVQPRLLDLREAVPSMLDMLTRLVGEDIAVRWEPMGGGLTILLDPSHLDQVLINLIVNARDAIGGRTGQVTIRAKRMTAEVPADKMAGTVREYVVLAVADDGHGMTEAVAKQIFEPFFTTKEIGHGTGLGLSTVHSVVQGAGGHIEVDTAPGCGTVFMLWFPACVPEAGTNPVWERPSERESVAAARPQTATSGMTALVVEDEEAVLRLAKVVLEREGFRVWTAAHPKDALALLDNLDTELDLLLTDVIMPEMNGRGVAEAVLTRFPGVKCLFMSGYPDDIIGRHGVLERGIHFVQKPFTMKVLRDAVWRAMGRASER